MQVWLTLADQYLHSISIDWEKTLRFAFNERSNPDDNSLGIQIVKVRFFFGGGRSVKFVCPVSNWRADLPKHWHH